MNPLFPGLNREQKEAVKLANGAVLILAGPGTGKTRTLTQRVAHLVHKIVISFIVWKPRLGSVQGAPERATLKRL